MRLRILKMKQRNSLVKLWLIIGIVAGFSTIIFFAISYIKDVILCDVSCSVQNDVAIALVLLSLMGVFVGSFTYYFIAERYEKKIDKIHSQSNAALRFLDTDDKKIVNSIIKSNGHITQSKLVSITGLSRVKISRHLLSLEQKNIILRKKEGMTNTISLTDDIKKIFLPEDTTPKQS